MPRITFLVNNDYGLPESYMVIRNESQLPQHEFFNKNIEMLFNSSQKENYIAFIGKNTELPNPHLEEMIVDLFRFYPEVGFIYTDAIINIKGHQFVDYFTGQDIPDESFFVNLTIPIHFNDTDQSNINVMQQMMQANKLFVHLPDPLIMVHH